MSAHERSQESISESTYQVADIDFALTRQSRALGRLGVGRAARMRRLLLHAASRRGRGRPVADRCAARRAALGGIAPLSGEDLVERLVELARHDDC